MPGCCTGISGLFGISGLPGLFFPSAGFPGCGFCPSSPGFSAAGSAETTRVTWLSIAVSSAPTAVKVMLWVPGFTAPTLMSSLIRLSLVSAGAAQRRFAPAGAQVGLSPKVTPGLGVTRTAATFWPGKGPLANVTTPPCFGSFTSGAATTGLVTVGWAVGVFCGFGSAVAVGLF